MRQATLKGVVVTFLSLIILQGSAAPTVNRRVAAAQADVAIIAQLEGSVWLERNKKTPLRESMLLNAGDVIVTDNGGGALIYQAYAPVTRLGPQQRQTIKQLSPPPSENALTAEQYARLKRILLNAKQRRGEPSPRRAGDPNAAALTLSEMRNSAVLEREPTFNWTRVSRATRYLIKIYDSHEQVIWSANTTATRIPFPAGMPPLTPGDYKWEVTALVGDKVSNDASLFDVTAFRVVGEDRAREIEADLAEARARGAAEGAANLVYISALMEHRLFPQAEAELKAALERAPKDDTLWELLMETYFQTKLWAARESARRLSERPALTLEMIRALEARR